MNILTRDGRKHSISLCDNLDMSLDGDRLEISTQDNSACYVFSELQRIEYNLASEAGIREEYDDRLHIRCLGRDVIINAPDEGWHRMEIADVNGRIVASDSFCGCVRISTSRWSAGAYIVAVDGFSAIKIAIP